MNFLMKSYKQNAIGSRSGCPWLITVQAYGSFKGRATDCNSSGDKVLIDDNKICRAEWEEYCEGYYSIDANGDIVKELTGLLG